MAEPPFKAFCLNKSVIFIFICFLAFNKVYGQPYYFKNYQVENGLSNNTVYFIRQDSRGFMWFATKDGLNRFDGSAFKVFRMNTYTSNKNFVKDYIYCILPGKEGELWVGAENGLYKFNPLKERLEMIIDSLPNVYELTIDHEGRMWFISSNTIYHFNPAKGKLKKFDPDKYFYASSICLTSDGQIWIASVDGFLKKYDEGLQAFRSYDIFSHSKTPSSRFIQKIRDGSNATILIGTSTQGLKEFDTQTLKYKDLLTYNQDKTTIFVRDILKNTESEYWIATESGIFIYHVQTNSFTNLKKKFIDPYSLNDNAIYSLFKDAEGSIWVGTFFGGVNYYARHNATFIKYFPDNNENSIGGSSIREICKDQYGNLWIGSEDGGLSKIHPKTNAIEVFKPTGSQSSIAYSNIHGLLADGDDLWIGTFEHGIDIMDIRTGKIKNHFSAGTDKDDIKSNFALCFYRTSKGDLYIGTANGLYKYNKTTGAFTIPEEIPGNLFITSILEDHENIIWIGTSDQGAYWFDPSNQRSGRLKNELYNNNSLPNNSINDMFEDKDNYIWFATDGGGLCKLNPERNRFTAYNSLHGLPSNFIYKVLEDNNNDLWVSTSRGLVNFAPDFTKVTNYTKANGLLNDQFNYHSGYKDADGRLYFGSVKGMVSFMPEDLKKDDFTPPLYLTGIQIFNKELDLRKDSSIIKQSIVSADKIVLPYDQSSVSLDFAALSYVSPQMTAYRFKLDGVDEKWTTINSLRRVYFTNLSPGTYVFQVKASTNGKWNGEPKKLTIEITPPWWNTWWAWLLYFLLTFGVIYYLITYYTKWLHEKKMKVIYESKINFFTNVAHEIKTPLTLIKGPVENLMELKDEIPDIREDLECLDRNTNRLTDLVSQVFDFRQIETNNFTLFFKKINLSELLRESYLRFNILAKKSNLQYDLHLPTNDTYIMADQEALQKIFSNLINNALKYADKKISITLNDSQKNGKGEQCVLIEFENDGHIIKQAEKEKIFEPFYRIKETSHKKGTGIGLSLSKSLAELHKGKLEIKFIKKDVNIFYLTLVTDPKTS